MSKAIFIIHPVKKHKRVRRINLASLCLNYDIVGLCVLIRYYAATVDEQSLQAAIEEDDSVAFDRVLQGAKRSFQEELDQKGTIWCTCTCACTPLN